MMELIVIPITAFAIQLGAAVMDNPYANMTSTDHDIADDGLVNDSITCNVSDAVVPQGLDYDGIVSFCLKAQREFEREQRS